ncbi:hypothetical protein BDE02_14G002900 [Populus trichocarpa]|nr:hypothetical protein BDE02_14G002900 [Populus trichocarpa]
MFSQMHIHLPCILLNPVLPVFQQAPSFHCTLKKENWPYNSLFCLEIESGFTSGDSCLCSF